MIFFLNLKMIICFLCRTTNVFLTPPYVQAPYVQVPLRSSLACSLLVTALSIAIAEQPSSSTLRV